MGKPKRPKRKPKRTKLGAGPNFVPPAAPANDATVEADEPPAVPVEDDKGARLRQAAADEAEDNARPPATSKSTPPRPAPSVREVQKPPQKDKKPILEGIRNRVRQAVPSTGADDDSPGVVLHRMDF